MIEKWVHFFFVYKEKYLIREKPGIDDLGGLIFKVFNMTWRIYFSGIRVVTFLGHHWGSYISPGYDTNYLYKAMSAAVSVKWNRESQQACRSALRKRCE